MRNKLWYNRDVPKTFEKKGVPMPIKVTESIRQEVVEIAEKEDRPVGYVARELMIRGLALYRRDGRLKDSVVHDTIAKGLAQGIPSGVTESEKRLGGKRQRVAVLKESAK